ncbi:hypothetical protein TELCIR_16626, partial [Teladorsagia circumcincta]
LHFFSFNKTCVGPRTTGSVSTAYERVVQKVPQLATDDYLVAFEDPSYSNGYSPPLPIPQRYVVSYKEVKGKNTKA